MKKTVSVILSVILVLSVLFPAFSVMATSLTDTIDRIEVENISVIKGTSGQWDTTPNGERFWYYHLYPRYTVYFNDGTPAKTATYNLEIDGQNYWLNCSTNQYSEHWEAGNTYTVPCTFMGKESSFDVTIKDSPVERIEVENISVIEGTNGYTYNYGNGNTFWYYNPSPKYTVYFNDGTPPKTTTDSVQVGEQWYNLSLNYSSQYENNWQAGNTYTVSCTFAGVESSFDVTIKDSPVERIEANENVTVYKDLSGYYTVFGGEQYYRYSYQSPSFTVYFNDGTPAKTITGGMEYDGEYYVLTMSDSQDTDHWEVGNTYTVPCSLMGKESSFDVTVEENPIERIEIKDVTVTENIDGSMNYDASGKQYFHYSYSRPNFTVYMKDGTKKHPDWSGCITFWGRSYWLQVLDNQYSEHWQADKTYTVPCTFAGKNCSFNVKVEKSHVTGIQILSVEKLKKSDFGGYYWDPTNYYPIPKFSYRIITDNNTDIYGVYNGPSNQASAYHDQDTHPWTVGGNNEFTAEICGFTVKVNVEIENDGDFGYIEQDDGIIITDCYLDTANLEIPAQIDGKTVVGIDNLGKYRRSFETITIPASVKYLYYGYFEDCENLKNIFVSEGNPNYADIDGVLTNKAKTKILAYPLAKGNVYNIPESITDTYALESYAYRDIQFITKDVDCVTVDGVTYTADMKKVIKADEDLSGSYTMPETVTEIADCAFYGCSELNHIKVSSSVTDIAYCSFSFCGSLKTIELPANLKSIDEKAFYASGLENIDIPSGVTEIRYSTFACCENLKRAELPENLKTIDARAFADTGLESISIPSSVKTIGYSAFRDSKLKTVNLGSGLTSIGEEAFSWCGSLKSVALPDSLTDLGASAFYYCTNLSSVEIGSGLTEISDWAFFGCSSLESIIIPSNIQRIDNYAFEACANLKTVEFKNSNVEIGEGAFAGCDLSGTMLPEELKLIDRRTFLGTSFTTADIPNTVTDIVYQAFYGSTVENINMPSSVKRISAYAFDDTPWYDAQPDGPIYLEHILYYYKGDFEENAVLEIKPGTTVIANGALGQDERNVTNISKIILPNGLKYIGESAFFGCDSITEINIPASVEEIGDYAFLNCSSLKSISVSPDSQYFCIENGMLFNKDKTELIYCLPSKYQTYDIPASVEVIRPFAFGDCYGATVIFNNNDVDIRDSAIGFVCGNYLSSEFDPDFNCHNHNNEVFSGYQIICDKDSTAEAYANENLLKLDATHKPVIPVCLHTNTVIKNAQSATCTEDGYTGDTYCLGCGNKISNGTKISPLGHSFTNYISDNNATCTADGTKTAKCDRCDATDTIIDTNSQLGHDYIPVVIPPTCTEQGYTTYTCSRCGDSYVDNYVSAFGHTLGDWIIDREAQIGVAGSKHKECTVCGTALETEEIPALENPVIPDENSPQIAVESKKTLIGKEFTLSVDLSKNPGLAYLKLALDYDSSAFELISATNADLLSGTYITSETILTKPYIIQWASADNSAGDGKIVTLTFKAKDDAVVGNYAISLDVVEAYNKNLEDVMISVENANIELQDIIIGDFNGDRIINGKDAILCSQALAGWNIVYSEFAADVNGDGVFNGKDAILLYQYLAGWDIVLG